MKQWKEREGYVYANVAGKKIAGPSKLSYEHFI